MVKLFNFLCKNFPCGGIKMIQSAKDIFSAGVTSVIPSQLIKNKIKFTSASGSGDKKIIHFGDKVSLDLNLFKKCYVVGFGKAVLPMAEELHKIMGENIFKTILSVPQSSHQNHSHNTNFEIYPGAKNNFPDQNSFLASEKILNLVRDELTPEDLLIVLISGGGSALLPFPIPPLTLQEKSFIISKLSRSGADIKDLNNFRQRISLVKGGGLLRETKTRRIISLILSDVLGDPLELIASGPTVPPPPLPQSSGDGDPLKILSKYNLESFITQNLKIALKKSEELNKRGINKNMDVSNILIGNNKMALEASSEYAKREFNYSPVILTSSLEGEAKIVGEKLAFLSFYISQLINPPPPGENPSGEKEEIYKKIKSTLIELNISNKNLDGIIKEKKNSPGIFENLEGIIKNLGNSPGICILIGGETTVKVREGGSGVGGRNQEICLSAAIKLDNLNKTTGVSGDFSKGNKEIVILSCGTDGIDGPCDAAGAVITSSTVQKGLLEGKDAGEYLERNDSYNFFRGVAGGEFHVMTGHTGTNVMDLIIILIQNNKNNKIKSKI